MCRIMDEVIQKETKETSVRIASNLLRLGNDTHEQIAEATGLTLDEVKQLAGQAAS